MPTFTLTRQQQEAMRVLRWLYDPTDNTRRQGRSTVLALGFLYQALMQSGVWVCVHDHVPNVRDLDRNILRVVLESAHGMGIHYDDIEIDQSRARFRLRLNTTIARAMIEALEVFDLHPDLDPPPSFRDVREARGPEAEKPLTIWDHLIND